MTILRLVRSPAFAGLAAADTRLSESDGGWRRDPQPLLLDGAPVDLPNAADRRVITPDERARLLAILDPHADGSTSAALRTVITARTAV